MEALENQTLIQKRIVMKLEGKQKNLIQNVHPVSISWTRNMFQNHTTFFKLPQNQICISQRKPGKEQY